MKQWNYIESTQINQSCLNGVQFEPFKPFCIIWQFIKTWKMTTSKMELWYQVVFNTGLLDKFEFNNCPKKYEQKTFKIFLQKFAESKNTSKKNLPNKFLAFSVVGQRWYKFQVTLFDVHMYNESRYTNKKEDQRILVKLYVLVSGYKLIARGL